jgi:hypothetical protein
MDCDPTTTSSKPFLWEEEVQFELMPFFFFSKQAQLKKKHKKKKKKKKKKPKKGWGSPTKASAQPIQCWKRR